MKCINCQSDCQEDTLSGSYYCEACNTLFGKEDIIEYKTRMKFEESTSDGNISIAGNIILSIIATIPILDILVTNFISKAEVSDGYKQTYIARLVSKCFIIAGLIFMYAICVFQSRQDRIMQAHDSICNLHQYVINLDKNTEPVRDINLTTKSLGEILSEIVVEDEEVTTEQLKVYATGELPYLDGAVVTGTTVREILADNENALLGILINTAQITRKYDENTYANFGYIVDGSELSESKTHYMYTGKLSSIAGFYTTDLNEFVYKNSEYVDKSKYIYYVNPRSEYKVTIVNGDESIIAIVFTEVTE